MDCFCLVLTCSFLQKCGSWVTKQVRTMCVISNLGSCPHPPMVLLCPGCLWEGGVGEAGPLGTSGVSPTASAGLRWVVVELPDGWLVAYGPQALCESLSLVPVKETRLQQIREKKDDNPKPMLHLAVFVFFFHLLPKAEALLALKKRNQFAEKTDWTTTEKGGSCHHGPVTISRKTAAL